MSKRSQEDRDKYASYNYAEMSNKVITSERSAARLNEPDGSATSLYGKLDGIKMGDRATVVREKSMKKPKKEAPAAVFFDEDFTGLAYTPSTSETRQTYGLISSLVSGILGDRPRDELKSFVDELLIILMNTELRDFDKKEQIDGELLKGIRKLTSEEFADLVNLSRGLTDFSTGADAEADTLDGLFRTNPQITALLLCLMKTRKMKRNMSSRMTKKMKKMSSKRTSNNQISTKIL